VSEVAVLDTSAFFALVDDEEGADEVEKYLRLAQGSQCRLMASFVSLTELRYITLQEKGDAAADYLIGLVKVMARPVGAVGRDALPAGCAVQAAYRISLADAFVAATTRIADATLVHKDPEFDALAAEIRQVCLPRKRKR